jgi:ubiquitin carboxyl-terminal hydrolase L3
MHVERWESSTLSSTATFPLAFVLSTPTFWFLTVESNTPFANIYEKAKTMNTAQRAELLEESDELEAAHTSFSQQGQTAAPQIGEEVEHHYVALVKHREPKTGKWLLYELDGRRLGPVERGEIPADEDLVGPTALKVMEEFVTREQENGRFSLIALAPSFD